MKWWNRPATRLDIVIWLLVVLLVGQFVLLWLLQ